MKINYKNYKVIELRQIAKELGVTNAAQYRRPQLILQIKKAKQQEKQDMMELAQVCNTCEPLIFYRDKLQELLNEINAILNKN